MWNYTKSTLMQKHSSIMLHFSTKCEDYLERVILQTPNRPRKVHGLIERLLSIPKACPLLLGLFHSQEGTACASERPLKAPAFMCSVSPGSISSVTCAWLLKSLLDNAQSQGSTHPKCASRGSFHTGDSVILVLYAKCIHLIRWQHWCIFWAVISIGWKHPLLCEATV